MDRNVRIFREYATKSSLTTEIKNRINDQIIKDKAKILEEIILKNGKKSRIFITINDINYGYQYLKLSTAKGASKYLHSLPRLGPSQPSYVDIDFINNPNKAREDLLKLVSLTLSYIGTHRPVYGCRPFGLILKNINSKSSDPNMICALTGDQFISKDKLFSVDYSTKSKYINYGTVSITDLEGTVDPSLINEWVLLDEYIPYDLENEHEEMDLF